VLIISALKNIYTIKFKHPAPRKKAKGKSVKVKVKEFSIKDPKNQHPVSSTKTKKI
jgi:hypothetical protein